VGARGENALIGHHRARVDVDANEACPHRRGHREGGQRIGTQDVDAERQRDGAADLRRHRGHRGHARGVHSPGGERHVAEILDEESVDAAVGEGLRVGQSGPRDLVHGAGPARAAGQRLEMHHADHRLGGAEYPREIHESQGKRMLKS
jgi:hypothetical protein